MSGKLTREELKGLLDNNQNKAKTPIEEGRAILDRLMKNMNFLFLQFVLNNTK